MFVEANTRNIFAKSQSIWFLRRWILKIFFFNFGCHGNQSKWALGKKIICLIEDHSRNISVKVLSRYLQWLDNKCHSFLFSHYTCKSMASLSYHSSQSFWAIAIKNIKFVEAYTKNISAKSQSYIPIWGDDFYRYSLHNWRTFLYGTYVEDGHRDMLMQ